jgi:flagellar biosynthesis protein FlhB
MNLTIKTEKAYLKRRQRPYKRGQVHNSMKNLIIGKVATFFGITSIVFTVLIAIITYYLLLITSPTAPTDYVLFVILSTILPYLFFAVLSLIIAVISRSVEKENLKKKAIPQAQPTEVLA